MMRVLIDATLYAIPLVLRSLAKKWLLRAAPRGFAEEVGPTPGPRFACDSGASTPKFA